MPSRLDVSEAIVALDPAFASIVAVAGLPPARRPAPVHERFPSLVRSITFQLLATSAASTIHERVISVCGGVVTPANVVQAGSDALKEAGLNRGKAEAMVALAEAVTSGQVALGRHGRLPDSDIIAEVSAIKGIGPWTVQMYLMHTMGRRDVWPVGDYGVRLGWSLIHQLGDTISERDLRGAGLPLAGFRSDVAWYCWQAVHVERSSK